ncbi:MAG: CoA transferase [Proteobacteria bacterium]|nr:CoA transferase [Pseudomonadota bacterium]
MRAPLAGIRVVEIASYVAAPAAGALLADLGADVVKVEVAKGEVYRHSTPRVTGIRSEFPEAPHFQMDNRGKRSLTLDLTSADARAALRRVIARADVVLTNMLPQRLEKYGLDAARLRGERPELIFASLSGYGPEGPDAETPAFDYTAYWARTGLMHQLHEPDAPPAFQRPGLGDHAASLALVSGILAALRTRDRDGVGQEVSVALQHIGFYVQGNDAAMTLATGQEPPRHDRRQPRNPLWNHYATRDGRWVFLVMIESDRYWPALCRALERPEWLEDERFAGAVPRYRNSAALAERLAACFAEKTLAEWTAQLEGRGLIWAPVQTLEEAVRDPQARANGVFAVVSHPEAGEFETVAPPVRLSAHPMPANRPAPALGADAEAVLAEAGLGPDEIAAALKSN